MALRQQIQALANQIADLFNPQKIVLFGSHAYGKSTSDSDVDLLVVMPCRGRSIEKEFEILQAVHATFPMDLLVRTPREIARGMASDDFFLKEIMTKGKVLYEAPHPPVGRQGRRRLSNSSARTKGAQVSKL
jgi:predicted nucleotidyltransferase